MKHDLFNTAITEILESINVISVSKSEHGSKLTRTDINNIVHNVCTKYKVNEFSILYSLGIA